MTGIDRKQITRNIGASIAQVVVGGVVLFALYRYLFDRLGIEQIGILSIVLATTSTARIADLGLTATVVKYVAQALAHDHQRQARVVVQTAALTLAVLMAILILAALPAFQWILAFVLPSNHVGAALTILPFALISLWANAVSGAVLGALDGCQRIDLRGSLVAASQLAYLVLVVLWVPAHGLQGVAYAHVAQAWGLLIVSWFVLRQRMVGLPFVPLVWDFATLRALSAYGANLQVISILGLMLDPVTKGIMAKFGGLAPLGYYEMANKLIVQLRAIIVESNRVVVPIVSRLHEQLSHANLHRMYKVTLRISLSISGTTYAIVVLSSPILSLVWIGRIENLFVLFLMILSVGWFVNTISAPAYFHNLGTGSLLKNVIGQGIIAALNVTLGIAFGLVWGAVGVAAAFCISLVIGSLVIMFSETSSWAVLKEILNSKDGSFLFKQVIVAVLGLAGYLLATEFHGFTFANLSVILASLFLALLAWNHLLRHARELI